MFSIINIKNKSNSTYTSNTLVNKNGKDHESNVTVEAIEPVETETSATTSETLYNLGDLNSGPVQPKTKVPT